MCMRGKEDLFFPVPSSMFAILYEINSYALSFRLPEKNRNSDVPISDTKTQQTSWDSREDLVPLNLSKQNQSDSKPDCSDGEELTLPLNLCLRPSSLSSALKTAEELQERPDVTLDDPFDQRQVAALALCQLSIASAVASSRGADQLTADSTDVDSRTSASKTKDTTQAKTTTSLKRANSDQTKNQQTKSNKRAKTPEWRLRRRPRCC